MRIQSKVESFAGWPAVSNSRSRVGREIVSCIGFLERTKKVLPCALVGRWNILLGVGTSWLSICCYVLFFLPS